MKALRACVLSLVLTMALAACSDKTTRPETRWDAYYARIDRPRAHVVVMPPEGATVPMAKLVAQYVVEQLNKNGLSSEAGDLARPPASASRQKHFVLTGVVEDNRDEPRVRYARVLRWLLTDSAGRVISTHAQGVDGTVQEWDFGSARLLSAIAIDAAGPITQMVLAESRTTTPIDPLRRGLLVDPVAGVDPADSDALTGALKAALRGSDILVTGDPRQAAFRLGGQVDSRPAPDGLVEVRITWTVMTLERQVLGRAVQENRVPAAALAGGWGELAPRVGQAAAVGVEHVFGARRGPPPGASNRATGAPPKIILPGEPGRAPPPPR